MESYPYQPQHQQRQQRQQRQHPHHQPQRKRPFDEVVAGEQRSDDHDDHDDTLLREPSEQSSAASERFAQPRSPYPKFRRCSLTGSDANVAEADDEGEEEEEVEADKGQAAEEERDTGDVAVFAATSSRTSSSSTIAIPTAAGAANPCAELDGFDGGDRQHGGVLKKYLNEAGEQMLKVKRGLAFVYLHYLYRPLLFKRKQQDVHVFLKQKSLSSTVLELEESISRAAQKPFRAALPEDDSAFLSHLGQSADRLLQRNEDIAALPIKRQALRCILDEWQQALTTMPRLDCCGRARRRFFSRAPIWVRRRCPFEDAAESILAARRTQLLSGMHVRFVGADGSPERGVDSGGLSRELMELALKAIIEESAEEESDQDEEGAGLGFGMAMGPQNSLKGVGEPMFKQQDDRTLQLLPCDERPLAMYFALGRLLATALVHASHGDVALPFALNDCLLKYIVGEPINAADVRRRDPIYYENRIAALLKPSGLDEMKAILCVDELFFEEDGVELKPGGATVTVTRENVEEYVKLLSEHYVCNEVRSQLSHLLAGFYDVIPREILQRASISFVDLGMLLSGVPNLDLKEWRRHAVVRPAGVDAKEAEEVAEWLWRVLEEWVQEELARVLAFTTGCSRLPSVGFRGLQPAFTVEVIPVGNKYGAALPTSHTCFNSLTLPLYPTLQELASKLAVAVREGVGSFDLR